ncbi:unnamed protein product [Heligmosomoides polygyrus]|uniref:Uncharacterized protein n=1 Tax=Heligmosomoides polygyrus TaxID=6339 RepID=A0A3P8BXV3_HELPZ|nr:unnamed protein product [Heligmosomoides polygyrus]
MLQKTLLKRNRLGRCSVAECCGALDRMKLLAATILLFSALLAVALAHFPIYSSYGDDVKAMDMLSKDSDVLSRNALSEQGFEDRFSFNEVECLLQVDERETAGHRQEGLLPLRQRPTVFNGLHELIAEFINVYVNGSDLVNS